MTTSNFWSLFGLASDPFFQETLTDASPHFPLDLFVGRQRELTTLMRSIEGSHSSRNVIMGSPGVGKTTLVQCLKSRLRSVGYASTAEVARVRSEGGAAGLMLEILAHVYEAVLGHDRQVAEAEPLRAARDLLRSSRLRDYQGGIQILGSGVHGGSQGQVVQPVDAALVAEAWRLTRDVVALAVDRSSARGVVLHINNFENLAGQGDLGGAAGALRDLRDFFLTLHLHTVLVGTDDVLVPVVVRHTQVRSIFPFPEPLAPLVGAEVEQLVQRRYDHLMLAGAELIPPVHTATARRVYSLFQGDLRGTLRALHEAVGELAGLGEDEAIEPLRFEHIATLLRHRYADRLRRSVSVHLVEKFVTLSDLGPTFTQAELAERWGVTVQRVGQLLPELEALGYVRIAGREGRSTRYALAGAGRIALGLSTPPDADECA